MTTYYATKWFLVVFLDAFPFGITIRIWDLFFLFGYDIVYTIGLGIMKMFESMCCICIHCSNPFAEKLLSLPFDQIMSCFRSFESMHDIDPDDFVTFVMKFKVKKKDLRKLEAKYQAEQKKSKLA